MLKGIKKLTQEMLRINVMQEPVKKGTSTLLDWETVMAFGNLSFLLSCWSRVVR